MRKKKEEKIFFFFFAQRRKLEKKARQGQARVVCSKSLQLKKGPHIAQYVLEWHAHDKLKSVGIEIEKAFF